jgi:hypothetical protein
LGIAHGAPTAELEVLGQITVHTDLEPTAEGQNIVRGRLGDEIGKPVSGQLILLSAAGRRLEMEPCPWLSPTDAHRGADSPRNERPVAVGLDGEFCFITDGEKGLILKAEAAHFVETTHDLDLGYERALSRPRFVEAPQTIDLFGQTRYVVQVLGRAEKRPPEGALLSLSLACREDHLISELSLDDSRVQRFEFNVPQALTPGTCQLVARAYSPTRKALQATRSVLVRDRIVLHASRQVRDANMTRVTITVSGSPSSGDSPPSGKEPINEGLLEARENGAFVALSPVRNGLAELELEMGQAERDIVISYASASPAFVAGESLQIRIAAKTVSSRWAGIHAVGLLLFSIWLAFTWLRPGREQKGASPSEPPKKALLQETGERAGRVHGRVLDAHTGSPLSHARLVLQSVGAERSEQLEAVTSNDAGAFEFATRVESHPLLRLVATSDSFMTLSATVKSAQVTVHLTERRRAVISSLVFWARKAGRPWDRKPSATPGSVEATATHRSDHDTANWAQAVAAAAYGESMPSEATVEALRAPQRPEPASNH